MWLRTAFIAFDAEHHLDETAMQRAVHQAGSRVERPAITLRRSRLICWTMGTTSGRYRNCLGIGCERNDHLQALPDSGRLGVRSPANRLVANIAACLQYSPREP